MAITFDGQNDRITTTSQGLTVPQNVSGTFQAGGLAIGAGSTILVTNSQGKVAIGTATISSSSNSSSLIVNGAIESLRDSAGEGGQVTLRAQSGGIYRWCIDNNSPSSVFRIFREDDTTTANGLEMFRIDSSGRVQMPYQPYARSSSSSLTSAPNNIPLNSYNLSRGGITISGTRFTVPVAGAYVIGYHHLGNSGSGACQVRIFVNGSEVSGARTQDTNSSNDSFGTQTVRELSANDYVEFNVLQGTVHSNPDYNSMWIWLIG